jgi:hypothetical protein
MRAAAILNLGGNTRGHYVVWIECCGVYRFASYWCVKTYEFSNIRRRRDALQLSAEQAAQPIPA